MSPAFVRSLRVFFNPCKCVYSSILQQNIKFLIMGHHSRLHWDALYFFYEILKVQNFKTNISGPTYLG